MFILRRFQITLLWVFFLSGTQAQVSPFNLLTNGDFESGVSGNGFQAPSPYNYLASLSGNSNPGDYAIISNPQPMNTAYFIAGTDHSGAGKMMVIDGITSGGNQRFWKAGSSGGGVGPLTVGQTYTFSYWIKSIAISVVDVSTTADILVSWNNASNITLISGSSLAPYPGNTASWQKVVYSFIPTSAFVNIELSNNNTNPVGNDFAVDDIEVLAPPQPLGIRYNIVNPSCPSATDGFISVYGTGGTPPYTYSYNGGAYTTNNIFSGLGNVSNVFVSVKDATTPTAAVVFSPSNITLAAPVNPLNIRPDSTICGGATIPLYASGSASAYVWTSTPNDPTIVNTAAQYTTASPTQNTTYTVSTTITRNRSLIFNGDFEQGDVGFESQYTSFPFPPNPSNPSLAQRSYSVVSNAQQFEPVFQPCVDHTNGSGKMMVIDGSTTPNIKVWSQKVAVIPNTNYNIQYWLQSVVGSNPAQLEMQVNGSPITGNASTSTSLAPSGTCTWQLVSYVWNSGANALSEITLINRNVSTNGNDFAIDDISMTHTVSCTFSKNSNITVNSSNTPTTNFSYNSPVCINGPNPSPILPLGFTAGGVFSSTLGISINGSTGTINLPTSSPGTYTVTYTVAASACQSAGSSSTQITISNSITPVTSFSYNSPACIGASNLTPNTASGFTTGGTFSSSSGLSINASTGAIDLAASIPGTYVVTYLLNATSCQSAANGNATVVINAAPPSPVAAPVVRYCIYDPTTPLTATGTNLIWYSVPTGGNGVNTPPTPSTNTIGTTTYYVAQRIGECESARTPISVVVSPKPLVDAGPDVIISPGQSIALQGNTNAGNTIINWTPGTSLSNPSILNPIASPSNSTTYYLTVQSIGCTGVDSVRVLVIGKLVIPNVFSPNGDGIHDRWIIQGIEGYPNASVELFNRYGQSIFRQHGYNALNAWNGSINGKPVPAGVYFYCIQGLGSERSRIGTLTLLR